jgi:hypothetical protein
MIVVYIAVACATVFSYITTRDYLIATPINDIVVSNLTVNVIGVMIALGAVAYYASKKLVKMKSRVMTELVAATVASSFVGIAFMVVMAPKVQG